MGPILGLQFSQILLLAGGLKFTLGQWKSMDDGGFLDEKKS